MTTERNEQMKTTAPELDKRRIERTIAGYLRKGSDGKRLKVSFKIISLEIRPYTIAQSIQRMYEDAWEERLLGVADEMNKIIYSLQRIDVLQQRLPSESLLQYDKLDMGELLCVYVTCRYSVTIPGSNIIQEETEVFVLSPNGETVLGKEHW